MTGEIRNTRIQFVSVPLCPQHNAHVLSRSWARRGAVGWGTALQAGSSRVRFPIVSLESFLDIILPAALWLWGHSAFNSKEYQKYFLGVKAAGAYGWQPCHLHAPTVLKYGNLDFLEPSGTVQSCNGIDLRFTIPGLKPSLRGEMSATNNCVTEDPRFLEYDAVSTGK